MVLRTAISGAIFEASKRITFRQKLLGGRDGVGSAAMYSYSKARAQMVSTQFLRGVLPAGLLLFAGVLAGQGTARRPESARNGREQEEVRLVSFTLDDVQKNWDRMLPEQEHVPYRHAKLVLFRDSYRSPCGAAGAATGPFYCPGDEKVYLDLAFFNELKQRFGAPGEFAQAYVLAHEIGHQVQKILGTEAKVRRLAGRNPGEANALSVRLELQADCFAGVWAHSTEQRNLVNRNDLNAALRAAAAVGDDRLQREGQGYANPDTFTHGTSAQREQWFRRGLDSGRISACDTFAAR
jgi:predicted metalloprotease